MPLKRLLQFAGNRRRRNAAKARQDEAWHDRRERCPASVVQCAFEIYRYRE